jgi:ABC-2 type transport system ATP-binding protein
MADLIIETRDLVKKFGKFTAVNGLSLEVPAGSIYGFVGPNGAGKTTTMRMLTTLTRPTSGQAWVGGHSVTNEPRAVRRAIGYMPDEFGVYDDMRVWEYLDFFAACYDIPESERRRLIEDLLELVDLSHRRDDMVDKLSRGMKQRLSLARTLAHDPSVLILDEPASGLDPRARVEIRELLVELNLHAHRHRRSRADDRAGQHGSHARPASAAPRDHRDPARHRVGCRAQRGDCGRAGRGRRN